MTIDQLVEWAHRTSQEKGWYDDGIPPTPERIALMHSELSEALEAYRVGDEELHYDAAGKPEGMAVELADCIIRIADFFGSMGWNLTSVLEEKMHYNDTRPHRHGGKRI